MADIALTFTVAIDCPDLTGADIADVLEAAEALPFGEEDLADRLRVLADRMARMLLTALDHAGHQ